MQLDERLDPLVGAFSFPNPVPQSGCHN